MRQGRESLHTWSLAMAIASLAAMAVWLAAPDLLSPRGMTAAYTAWTLIGFGSLFVIIRGHRRWADIVTGVRVLLCVVLFASHALDPHAAWWKMAVAIAIIALDAVDGALARRQGATESGAVFDMESDAFYLVTMCGVAHVYLGVHPIVFVVGAMRPLYVCTWAVLRLFIAPRSPNRQGSQRGRIIHVSLAVALIADLAPFIPQAGRTVFAAIGAALISYSYAIDFWETRKPAPREP
ncbi:MAG TPA: CDP-alcohol phosphatidyltransferase family protein [Kofleriaceae bacterium]|nr:CDP-alcohol phosphatidyltransferase family protein [Kofleriaceae bacterium]